MIHPQKTKIVCYKDSNRREEHTNIEFSFLGYTFRQRKTKARIGSYFTSFIPAINKKSKFDIQRKIRELRLLWQTNKTLEDLAKKYNPVIRGWLNHYGEYGKIELLRVLEGINKHLCFWIKRKYKKFKHKPFRAITLLLKMIKVNSALFVYWQVGIT